ncbi:unnamed protein product, partial [Linum tenue]
HIFLWCNNNCLITLLTKRQRFFSGISEEIETQQERAREREREYSSTKREIDQFVSLLRSRSRELELRDFASRSLCCGGEGKSMRIRKRKVPLPFHLLSPVPIPAPSFFSSPDPDTTAATTPLVQLRHGASVTRPPIPASDDNKAVAASAVCCGGGAAGPTVRSGGIGPAHPIYPISWKDEKEEFGINANNVAAAARKGSKCSSRSSNADPEMLRQQRQPAAASASHLPPGREAAGHPPPHPRPQPPPTSTLDHQ